MLNSRFEEPTGLSSNNGLPQRNIRHGVAAAARYPEIRSFSTTGEARIDLNGVTSANSTTPMRWCAAIAGGKSASRRLAIRSRPLPGHAGAGVADKPVVIVLLDSSAKMTRVGDANRIKRWMESASLTPERRPV